MLGPSSRQTLARDTNFRNARNYGRRRRSGSLATQHWHRSYTTDVSSALHFYQNRELELYAAKETRRLTLRQLIFFGRAMNEERLVQSANYVRSELPVRIAHRLRDMQALPYIVVTQEEVASVYELYWKAFDKFRTFPPITNMAENIQFCTLAKSLLNEHASIIPSLALGLSLCSPHLPPDQLDAFMKRMLISRISRRVLVEHHITLTEDFLQTKDKVQSRKQSDSSARVGIITTQLNPEECIERCVELLEAAPKRVLFVDPERKSNERLPHITINGHLDTRFAYIRGQFEYIIFELLKNAIFATSCNHSSASTLPDIEATIAAGQDEIQVRISDQGGGLLDTGVAVPSDLLSFSHLKNTSRLDTTRIGALKTISTRPQGMTATVAEQVTAWKEQDDRHSPVATPEEQAGVGLHTRLGIGLPMSNIFATYFGGSLQLVSLNGWGTDAYLRLPRLGTKFEGI